VCFGGRFVDRLQFSLRSQGRLLEYRTRIGFFPFRSQGWKVLRSFVGRARRPALLFCAVGGSGGMSISRLDPLGLRAHGDCSYLRRRGLIIAPPGVRGLSLICDVQQLIGWSRGPRRVGVMHPAKRYNKHGEKGAVSITRRRSASQLNVAEEHRKESWMHVTEANSSKRCGTRESSTTSRPRLPAPLRQIGASVCFQSQTAGRGRSRQQRIESLR